jgi:NAD(P)-dependent dehydrogenase (short-subunit alcohol dehydrogenase family)
MSEEWKNAVIAGTPLGRIGTPEDIAKAVAMLCTSDADWINGQCILCNGGARI